MKVWNEQGELLVVDNLPDITVDAIAALSSVAIDSKVNVECTDDGNNYTVCVKLSAGKPTLYLSAAGTSRLKEGRRQIRCDDDDLYYTLAVKLSAGKPAFYLITPGEV